MQESKTLSSFVKSMAFTVTILLAFLQLKKDENLLSSHPTTLIFAVSTTVIFFLGYPAFLLSTLSRRSARIAFRCLLLIGSASVASLSSLLLPAPFVFVFFGLLSGAGFVYCLYDELVITHTTMQPQHLPITIRLRSNTMMIQSQSSRSEQAADSTINLEESSEENVSSNGQSTPVPNSSDQLGGFQVNVSRELSDQTTSPQPPSPTPVMPTQFNRDDIVD